MASIINATTTAGVSVQGDNSGSLQLATNNGTTAVTIDTSQNVGIGTSSPASKLNISGTAGATVSISNTSTSLVTDDAMGTLDFTAGTTNTTNARVSGLVVGTSEAGGSLAFETRADGGSLAEQARITSTGDLQFNSGYGSVATAYGCRAWVNFNGTGTVAIRASGNVSSITDNGTGDYTVNFTTAMPDANFAVSGWARVSGSAGFFAGSNNTPLTTTSARIGTLDGTPSFADAIFVTAAIFR